MAHPPLHTGKWTQEESEYVKELIKEFEAGSLNIDEGVSLRRFLSRALNCSPKRISKKFEGTSYNGKQVYKRKISNLTPDEIEARRRKLREMERRYMDSLKVLEMVEASRKPVHAQAATIQSNILPLPIAFDSLSGASPIVVGNGASSTLGLPGLSREARVAQLNADITLASLAFGGSNIAAAVVAPRRSSLGLLGRSAQSDLLTALATPSLTASSRSTSPSSQLTTLTDPLEVSHHLTLNQLLGQGPASASPQTLPPVDTATLRAAHVMAGPSNHSQLEGLKRGWEPSNPAESIPVAAVPNTALPAYKRLKLI